MANPQAYSDIDPVGDTILVLFQGNPDASETETNCDIAGRDALFDDARSFDTSTIENIATHHALEPQQASDGGRDTSSKASYGHSIQTKVSSYVLERHSVVFRELLERRTTSPGVQHSPREPIRIPLWNDDPRILIMVLKILHDGVRDDGELEELRKIIPDANMSDKYIDLTTLAQVAVVVEKYQLHVAVKDFLKSWIEDLWNYLECATLKDALAWTWITWVFGLTEYFDEATRYLVRHGTGSIEKDSDLEFPIPSRILGKSIYLTRTEQDS